MSLSIISPSVHSTTESMQHYMEVDGVDHETTLIGKFQTQGDLNQSPIYIVNLL